MKSSEPIEIAKLTNGNVVSVVFVHTDNYAVIAEISASIAPGILRMIKGEQTWICLEDSLDRLKLLHECFRTEQLVFDLEAVYSKYTTDHFVKE